MTGCEYNMAATPRSEAILTKYCDWLASSGGNLVLDIGCGDGTSVKILSKRGQRAVGLDLRLWPWPSELNVVRGDGYSLPFADGIFDAVGCLSILEHLTHPVEFLEEMVRVIKTGGRIVVGAPNMYGSVLLHPGHSITHRGGVPRYARNLVLHFRKQFESIFVPDSVSFDRLEPDMNSVWPGASDYDAVCATDPAVVRAVLRRCGVKIVHQSPSLEYASSRLVETTTRALEVLPVVRDLFGGIFIVGRKVLSTSRTAHGPESYLRPHRS